MFRFALPCLLAALLVLPTAAFAQIDTGDLPVPDTGAVGEILDPVTDLVDDIIAPIEDALGDIPFDNAVQLTGEDAVDAAIALSQATFETSGLVLLARDDIFADTLSSVSAQGIAGAPLLLTQTSNLDDRVVAELERLQATDILILGNEAAIDPLVENRLRIAGYEVERTGGPTRIETAIEVAKRLAPSATTAILLRAYPSQGADQSQAYADALSVGPFGSLNDYPVLLTTSDTLHQGTMDYIEQSDIDTVYVVGGGAAISDGVLSAVDGLVGEVKRLAGDNRYATAISIAQEMGFTTAADPSRIILTEAGDDDLPLWSAGFAAAAHAAVYEGVVLLANGPLLPPETITYLAEGLIANALRLNNEPLICNSFVNIVACEAASLLMLGLLDEVNALTGGQIGEVLGPILEQVMAAIEGVLADESGLSPALVSDLLSVMGTTGGLEDLAAQPQVLQDASVGLVGTVDNRPSASRQQVSRDLLTALSGLLGDATIDTSNTAQAQALAGILSGLGTLLGASADTDLFGETEALLASMDDLVQQVLGDVDLGELGNLVGDLGIDGLGDAEEILGATGSILSEGGDAGFLVQTYGQDASGLARQIDDLQRNWGA